MLDNSVTHTPNMKKIDNPFAEKHYPQFQYIIIWPKKKFLSRTTTWGFAETIKIYAATKII